MGPSSYRRRRAALLLAGLGVALLLAALANAAIGAVRVPPERVLAVVADHLGIRIGSPVTPAEDAVVWTIRLPRLVLATTVGAALAASGALLQGVFRNPLAEPSVIGVSSGAAVGAVAAIVGGFGRFGSASVPLAAFVGALAAATVVYLAARSQGRTDTVALILSGVAVNVMASAATGLLTYVADDNQLRDIVFWTLGSAGGATWPVVRTALVPVAAVLLALPFLAPRLDLLALGEREAGHLGVDVERLRLAAVALASLATACAVATAGVVGFVGLVAPHLVRMTVGPHHRVLLPASALGGAVLVLVADLGARTIAAPQELPLGVLTALAGGPYLLWLIRRTRPADATLP
ncbi:MAG: FecCD family ABC transporter permease [Acidimicrobiia bacterium]